MRATVMYGAGDVRIENVPDAEIKESTDALVRVTRACICGSDLWPYNQLEPTEAGQRNRLLVAAWTPEELDRIGAAEELELASMRDDGALRKPVTMWVVRDGDDVYVRSVNGRESSWFRGAQARHEAHVQAGGVDKDVELVETEDLADELDAAYDAKYGRRYPSIVPSIVGPAARAATLRLVPR